MRHLFPSFLKLVVVAIIVCMSLPSAASRAIPTTSLYLPMAVSNHNPSVVYIHWWHISSGDPVKSLFQSFANQYMTAHPKVVIDITIFDNNEFKSQLSEAMQAGNPPDIFQSWGGGVLADQAKAGMLKDITPDLDADGATWRNTFGTGALGLYSYGGKNYGVPWDLGMIGFWYNKDMFTQAGITIPPTSWTEFLADISALKTAGFTPIALGEGDQWPGMEMWSYLATRLGGQAAFEAAYNRTGSFADPPFVQAGQKILDLIALNPFQDGFLSASYGDQAALVGNGQAAMELMGQWAPSVEASNSTSGNGIGDKLGFFPFPMLEGGAGNAGDVVGGGNGHALGRNASPEAVDFVKFMSSVQNQTALASSGAAIPVVKGAEVGLTDPLMLSVYQHVVSAPYFQLYFDQFLPSAVGPVLNDSTFGIFAATLTPLQAAQAIEDSVEDALK